MTTALQAWSADFANRSAPVLRSAIEALVRAHPDDSIVGIGIYTDADATSVVACAQTLAHASARVEQSPQHASYFAWSTGEWDLDSIQALPGGLDGLDSLVDELERVADAVEDGEFGETTATDFRDAAWTALASALAGLARDGFFRRWAQAVVVLDAADGAVSEDQRRSWIRAINSAESAAAHARWMAKERSSGATRG